MPIINEEDLMDTVGIVGDLKPGRIVMDWDEDKDRDKTIHYAVRSVKELTEDFNKLYNNPTKPTRKDFVELFKKHSKKRDDDITDYLDRIENEEELLKVVKRRETKDGKVIIELEKISNKERLKLVTSITKKLLKKLKPEHIKSMVEEGIRRNNDIDILKKIDKKLSSKKPVKIEGKKGCYKFVIDGIDLYTMS